MNCYFDFHTAAKEFSKTVNTDAAKWYQLDAKTLQLRWTDIEIRKYRMNQRQNTDAYSTNASKDDDLNVIDDEELPPLQESPKEDQNAESSRSAGVQSEDDTGAISFYTNLEELD